MKSPWEKVVEPGLGANFDRKFLQKQATGQSQPLINADRTEVL